MHINDNEFLRGKVPMTKEEVRAISIAKLNINSNSSCIDIGAGSGSIAIEMAKFAYEGQVSAIELNEDAIELIKKNIAKHRVTIDLISGKAPEQLPNKSFDRVFIGGSKGQLAGIFKWIDLNLAQNGIVVLNFIVIENLAEAQVLAKTYGYNSELISVQISKGKKIGEKTMMLGENPIYILKLTKA